MSSHGVWIFIATVLFSLGSAVAAADFGASLGHSRSHEATEETSAKISAVQSDLIWTGDYNGMVDGDLGPNTRRAIEQWQTRHGFLPTGELTADQVVMLRDQAGSERARFGWTSFRHPNLGYAIAYPATMLQRSRPMAYGGREFFGEDRLIGLTIEVTPPMTDADFRALHGNLSASQGARRVTYSRRGAGWLVATGDTDDQGFYTRVVRRAGAVVGYTFTWPKSLRKQFEPAVLAMASSFEVPEELEPGSRNPVDPRDEIKSNASSAILSRSLDSNVLPSMPGPPLRAPLDARDVFRTVHRAVWVVLAASSTPSGVDDESIALGSAVAVSHRHLLTNCHTLEGRNTILIFHRADDPEPLAADVVQLDRASDRCLLVTQVALPSFARVRPLEDVEVGERVYTVGAPSGLDLTLGDGLVSSLRVSDGLRFVQTTAPISPGSSGGGLFDNRGNLIGITTFLIRDAQNLNFALAASDFWHR